ncbi:RHS repeat-associated core domain-containing protein [Paenibacillus sp. 19GGS1-52]|nr:RHS repeat-associated core domain-containing protein [Paenibacillus sp. 19GGS1-52]
MNEMGFQYDLFNTLVAATKGNTTTSFDISADGMRCKKSTGTSVKQYRYNEKQEVVSELNGSNTVTADYVRGDRLLVKKDRVTSKDYYYLYNGHGDVIQIVDTSRNIVNSYAYDTWGNLTNQTDGIQNSFKYAGEIYDEETGLYYLRARYYDATVGRFLNEDTYYQVTSKAKAKQIISDGVLTGSKQEAGQVFVWTTKPTLQQAKNSGARYLETVIEFEIPSSSLAVDRTNNLPDRQEDR